MSQNDILNDYFKSLYGIEPLSVDEETALAHRIQNGDDKALEKLIRHNLRFVVFLVRNLSAWQHSNVPVEDIVSMGNEALFMAGRSWKPTNNSSFATYAKPFILRGVKRELNNTANMIRLPVNIMLEIKKLKYAERTLAQILCRPPTKKELSLMLKSSEKRIGELQAHMAREPMSLNELKNDDHYEEKIDD